MVRNEPCWTVDRLLVAFFALLISVAATVQAAAHNHPLRQWSLDSQPGSYTGPFPHPLMRQHNPTRSWEVGRAKEACERRMRT